jgi:hypothetical protein
MGMMSDIADKVKEKVKGAKDKVVGTTKEGISSTNVPCENKRT